MWYLWGMENEMKKSGSRLPAMVEYLKLSGWTTYEHHDNWVMQEWSDERKKTSLLDTHKAFLQCVNETIGVPLSVQTICGAMKTDDGYRIGWLANIAMAFKDCFNLKMKEKEDFTRYLFAENGLHEIANEAADNFLKQLCGEKVDPKYALNGDMLQYLTEDQNK